MISQFERQLKKGIFEMLVLTLLSRTKMYGYQIIQALKMESDEFFVLKEGTLYPILYRLEENGFAKSQWVEPEDGKTPKKYYEITPLGKERLALQKNYWSVFTKKIDGFMKED